MKVFRQFTSVVFLCSFFTSEQSLLAEPPTDCEVPMTCDSLDDGLIFDYVVIGTGPASGPVIRRLVDSGYKVLILEKGPYFSPSSPTVKVDGDAFDDTFQMKEDAIEWEAPPLLSISNHSINSVGLEAYGIDPNLKIRSRKREYPYKQVQGFGGQTLTYGGFAVRPSSAAFEKWPNITYDNMLPWYRKSEASSWACGVAQNASGSHSCGNFSGFMSVNLQDESTYPKIVGIVPSFCAAGAFGPAPLWMDTNNNSIDYNGASPKRTFCGPPQIFINKTIAADGSVSYERSSLQQTYLPCAYLKSQQNLLKICVNTKVTRLILDADNRVTGAFIAGIGITVTGTQFILAAGSRFSPQLLMSSGIGENASFGTFGLKAKVDLPDVGRYFHDEWGFTLSFKIASQNATAWTSTDLPFNRHQMQLIKWATGAQGEDFADVQIYLRLENRLGIDDYLPESAQIGISDKSHDMFSIRVNLYQNDTFGETSGVFPVGSNGHYIDRFTNRVKMFDNANKSDRFIQGAVSGYNKAMELVEMIRTQSLNGEPLKLNATDSTAALITAANQGVQPFVRTLWDWANLLALHGAGTCGMGRVVDSDLKVFNVPNLYISDMSAVPFPIPANPTATLYALGERLAAHLLSLSQNIQTTRPSQQTATIVPTQSSTPTPGPKSEPKYSKNTFIEATVGAGIGGIVAGVALVPFIRFFRNLCTTEAEQDLVAGINS